MRCLQVVRKVTLLALLFLTACGGTQSNSTIDTEAHCSPNMRSIQWQRLLNDDCEQLSAYGLFESSQDTRAQIRFPGIEFSPASALFTDYAQKYRFVLIPPGTKTIFRESDGFDFPVGSVLIKSFALPVQAEIHNEQTEQLIETRLLIRREFGWKALVYSWIDETGLQFLDDARRIITGQALIYTMSINGMDTTFTYQVPDQNQCKICHQSKTADVAKLVPIGLKSRHLNHSHPYHEGTMNQLKKWESLSLIEGLPEDLDQLDAIPNWQNSSAPLADRAKGYLDINCAHCHSEGGSAALSGLRLEYWRELNYQHGICNDAHGWDGGGTSIRYDIVPGFAEDSAIPFRMQAHDARDAMPPLGRQLHHTDAVELIKEWINSMEPGLCR